MLFYVENAKLCTSNLTMKEKFKMDGKEIVDVREEKDLGFVIQDVIKLRKQCLKASNTGFDQMFLCVQNKGSDSSAI